MRDVVQHSDTSCVELFYQMGGRLRYMKIQNRFWGGGEGPCCILILVWKEVKAHYGVPAVCEILRSEVKVMFPFKVSLLALYHFPLSVLLGQSLKVLSAT